MKFHKMILILFATCFFVSISAAADDFDWMRDFNVRAEADPSGFRARLTARFQIGDAQVNTVLSNVEHPADAYMVFRLGELSAKPTDYVMQKYRSGKGRGWGVIAKSLGIKPGSPEFHALKNGSGFYDDNGRTEGKGKGNGKGKSKGRD